MTEDIIHRSKIGLEIVIPTILILGAVITVLILNRVWIGIITCGLTISLIANVYVGTVYKITTNKRLLIKCGVFEKVEIDVKEIECIKQTRELSNAPALSIDRLEIKYKGGRVLVSPKDKKRFIDDLRKLNPKI